MDCEEDISKLGLKALTCNALKRNGINTLADLLASNPEQIINFRNIGRQGLTDIYFSLKNNAGIILSDYENYIRTDDANNSQGYASGYKTFHNLEEAKDHFRKRYNEMVKNYPFDIWSRFGIASVDWDTIRRFTCHIFGVSVQFSSVSSQLSLLILTSWVVVALVYSQFRLPVRRKLK